MKLALGTVQFGLPYGIANQGGQVSREEAGHILVVVGVDGTTQFKELILAANAPQSSFPRDLACDDERLINPANWHQLQLENT